MRQIERQRKRESLYNDKDKDQINKLERKDGKWRKREERQSKARESLYKDNTGLHTSLQRSINLSSPTHPTPDQRHRK